MNQNNETITAICTPQGQGALGIIRISGADAIAITQQIFSKNIQNAKGYTAHYGNIVSYSPPRPPKGGELKTESAVCSPPSGGQGGAKPVQSAKPEIIDEVILNVFRAPHSFTKEDVVEISCHGSPYILQRVLQLILEKGARLAEAGEFTKRAFMNGAMDLAQAEAVADLIAAESAAAHRVALHQLRGGFSSELKALREQLLNFVSLIELELDFAEEDVEFADRTQLQILIQEILAKITKLIASFRLGNAIKKGVPVAIVGKPNAGKSTLLNALLEEEKAIVSSIAGTTRDVIEDTVHINDILFRFMDTAGLRETEDEIEKIGVQRTLAKMEEAQIILYLCSALEYGFDDEGLFSGIESAKKYQELFPNAKVLLVANKVELRQDAILWGEKLPLICISAKNKDISDLTSALYKSVTEGKQITTNDTIVTNVRHVEALREAQQALETVLEGINFGLTGDLVSIDIRTALHHIGSITGEINTEEILGNIFGKFCIGK